MVLAQVVFDLFELNLPAVGAFGLVDEAFDLKQAEQVRGPRRRAELGFEQILADPAALERATLEALQQPKMVPGGLQYFSFERFSERLLEALLGVIKPTSRGTA